MVFGNPEFERKTMMLQKFNVAVLVCVMMFLGTLNHCMAEPRLLPVDEGEKDKSFKEFRDRLYEAVKNQDEEFILKILHPRVILAYDEKKENTKKRKVKVFGIKAFLAKWEPDNKQSPFWNTISEILSLGGTFADTEKKQFIAPYVYSLWPDDLNPDRNWAITGQNINVYEQPDLNSPVIKKYSYDIVKASGVSKDKKWIKLTPDDSKTGFVPGQYIRSKNDYSIGFLKLNDQWVIKRFIGKPRSKVFPPP